MPLEEIATLRPVSRRLRALHELSQQIDAMKDEAVAEARAAGRSWFQIGSAFGISGEGARKKWRALTG